VIADAASQTSQGSIQSTVKSAAKSAVASLNWLLGPHDEDPYTLAELFHLPLPDAHDSVSTQTLLEKIHTEAALLKTSIALSNNPSFQDNVTLHRLATAAAVIKQIETHGLQNIRPKGEGDRRMIDALSQQSIDFAVDLIMRAEPPERPKGLPPLASFTGTQLQRPVILAPSLAAQPSAQSVQDGNLSAFSVKEAIAKWENASQAKSIGYSTPSQSIHSSQASGMQRAIEQSMIAGPPTMFSQAHASSSVNQQFSGASAFQPAHQQFFGASASQPAPAEGFLHHVSGFQPQQPFVPFALPGNAQQPGMFAMHQSNSGQQQNSQFWPNRTPS